MRFRLEQRKINFQVGVYLSLEKEDLSLVFDVTYQRCAEHIRSNTIDFRMAHYSAFME